MPCTTRCELAGDGVICPDDNCDMETGVRFQKPGDIKARARRRAMVVGPLPSIEDGWLRRFFDGPDVVYSGPLYDEVTRLSLAQWDALRDFKLPGRIWPGGSGSGEKTMPLKLTREVVWPALMPKALKALEGVSDAAKPAGVAFQSAGFAMRFGWVPAKLGGDRTAVWVKRGQRLPIVHSWEWCVAKRWSSPEQRKRTRQRRRTHADRVDSARQRHRRAQW